MFILNNNQIQNIYGAASESASFYFNLKIKEIPLESLPILLQLSEECLKNKWDINRYTSELINAGIDSKLIAINPSVNFDLDQF